MKTILSIIFAITLRRLTHEVAANEKDMAIAVNATAMAQYDGEQPPAEEWLMISPYGEFPHPKGLQRVTKRHAETMVTAFNSFSGRMGRIFRGLPIFVGHPDVMPDRWKDDSRIGKVTALEAREDGFYGHVAWNDRGLQNRAQGYHVYPSPVWLFPKNKAGLIDPDQLLSIGMTNTPQIAESKPWTANAAETGTNQEPDPMKEKLIKLLGLAAEATDEQIENAVNSKITGLTEITNQLNAANTKVTTLEGDLEKANLAKDQAENAFAVAKKDLLDAAINSGMIVQADRGTHETAMNADFGKSATALLTKKDAALNTKEIILGDRKASIATAAERSALIDNAVNARMKADGCDYDTAYNAVEKDPAFSAVFAAMTRSTSEQKA